MDDSNGTIVVRFEIHEDQPRFPYHVDFQVHVEYVNNTIKHTVIDEGSSTSIMSLSYWKGIGSPPLSQSTTM